MKQWIVVALLLQVIVTVGCGDKNKSEPGTDTSQIVAELQGYMQQSFSEVSNAILNKGYQVGESSSLSCYYIRREGDVMCTYWVAHTAEGLVKSAWFDQERPRGQLEEARLAFLSWSEQARTKPFLAFQGRIKQTEETDYSNYESFIQAFNVGSSAITLAEGTFQNIDKKTLVRYYDLPQLGLTGSLVQVDLLLPVQ